MGKNGRIMDRLIMAAELPAESAGGVPITEIISNKRVVIERHKGIIGYSHNSICVHVSFGVIQVCGSSLSLAQMTKERLVITGWIESVALCKGN